MNLALYVAVNMELAGFTVSVSDDGFGNLTLNWPSGTPQETIDDGNLFYDALDKTEPTVLAWELARLRAETVEAFLADQSSLARITRALAITILSEVNLLRSNICTVVGEAQSVWNPANMANGAGVTSPSVTVTGAAIGDLVEVSPPISPAGVIVMGFVPAANQVQVRLQNGTGAAVDPPSGTWGVRVRRPLVMIPRTVQNMLDAVSGNINLG